MAAPGTKTLARYDTTTKLAQRYFTLTTQPGGVQLISGLHRILFVQATFAEFISEPATLSLVISTDKKTAMVYSTSDVPKLVHVVLTGE